MSESLAGNSASAATRSPNWHVSVDRAWRSSKVRREFERANSLVPLATSGDGRDTQITSGYAERYHHRFLLWATRRLGIEQLAPAEIRQGLSAGM